MDLAAPSAADFIHPLRDRWKPRRGSRPWQLPRFKRFGQCKGQEFPMNEKGSVWLAAHTPCAELATCATTRQLSTARPDRKSSLLHEYRGRGNPQKGALVITYSCTERRAAMHGAACDEKKSRGSEGKAQ